MTKEEAIEMAKKAARQYERTVTVWNEYGSYSVSLTYDRNQLKIRRDNVINDIQRGVPACTVSPNGDVCEI